MAPSKKKTVKQSFSIKFKHPKVLRGIAECVKELVSDAVLEVTDHGLEMQAMDVSHACLITLCIDPSDTLLLDSYAFDKEDPLLLGINVGNLCRILKCAVQDDAVTMFGTDEDPDLLHLNMSNGSDRTLDFDLKLMNIECDKLGIPESKDDVVRLTLTTTEFSRIIRDLASLGDAVELSIKKQEGDVVATLTCEGDIGRASLTITRQASSPDHGGGRGTFSLKHLVSIAKACTL